MNYIFMGAYKTKEVKKVIKTVLDRGEKIKNKYTPYKEPKNFITGFFLEFEKYMNIKRAKGKGDSAHHMRYDSKDEFWEYNENSKSLFVDNKYSDIFKKTILPTITAAAMFKGATKTKNTELEKGLIQGVSMIGFLTLLTALNVYGNHNETKKLIKDIATGWNEYCPKKKITKKFVEKTIIELSKFKKAFLKTVNDPNHEHHKIFRKNLNKVEK
jgi:hypothetical protein